MKKAICLFLLVCVLVLCGCTQKPAGTIPTQTVENIETQAVVKTAKLSGSFTATVRDVIPDYCLDDTTPMVAVVTEFQSRPFTLAVGQKIGSQLEPGKTYVFTAKPMVVDCPKEYLAEMKLASIVWLPGFEITDFRIAEEGELGLSGLQLTIE